MSEVKVKATGLPGKGTAADRRAQTPPEPTAEELQFIYRRLEQLSDQQLLAEMRGTAFPRRSRMFIQHCRREYAAAGKVIQGQAETSQPSAEVGGNGEHASDVLQLLGGQSKRLALLPAMFVPARELYHDCARARSANGSGRHAAPAASPEPEMNAEGAFLCHTRGRYLNLPDWSFDAVIPWIGMPCASSRSGKDSPQQRMLCESLRQHLDGSVSGELWTEWESLAVQYVRACFDLWNDIRADADDLFQVVVAWARSPEEIRFSLEDGFSRTIYEKVTCSGFCDAHPCGPAEYSYAEPRVLLGKRQSPLLRYGRAVLLNASARTKDMLRVDRTAELTRERIVDPVVELHQHLISKYDRSAERTETLRLQGEVAELGDRLRGEFGSLLEGRILPGRCLICSRG
ncbi:MAG: hypothetical protein FJ020_00090 [Chloroflexi bacterium]|nr:hypothetical protein [Chloroflexota bacterium]